MLMRLSTRSVVGYELASLDQSFREAVELPRVLKDVFFTA